VVQRLDRHGGIDPDDLFVLFHFEFNAASNFISPSIIAVFAAKSRSAEAVTTTEIFIATPPRAKARSEMRVSVPAAFNSGRRIAAARVVRIGEVSTMAMMTAIMVRRAVVRSGHAMPGESRLIDSSPEKASQLPAKPLTDEMEDVRK
jgi:hypothetical protein